jgi:hypothetical protein
MEWVPGQAVASWAGKGYDFDSVLVRRSICTGHIQLDAAARPFLGNRCMPRLMRNSSSSLRGAPTECMTCPLQHSAVAPAECLQSGNMQQLS